MKPPMKPKAPARPTAKRTPPPAKIQAVASRAMPRMVEEDYDDRDESAEPTMKLSHAFIVVLVLHVIAVGGVFAFNMVKANRASAARLAPVAETVSPAQPVVAKPAVAPAETKPVKETSKPLAQTAEPRQLVQPAAPEEVKPAVTQQAASAIQTKPVAAVAVPKTAPVGAADAKQHTHTVVAGDTLTRIAGLYGVPVESIQKANDLPSATSIRVGQTLKIPAAPAKVQAAPAPKALAAAPAESKPAKETAPAAPKPATAKTAEAAPAAGGEIYTVAKGDNPYAIAHRHKVSYEQLLALNNITDPTKLQIGQKLKLPPKSN